MIGLLKIGFIRKSESNTLIKCIWCDSCLKFEFLQQMYGSLYILPHCVLLKANIFSKTGPKNLQILLVSKFEKLI